MKTSHDPRHRKRIQAVQELFANQFNPQAQLHPLAQNASNHQEETDKVIAQAAPARPIAQINKIDLAILRLSLYELLFNKETPYKVIVDEAVELSKEFGAESSPAFINGVLGFVIKQQKLAN